MTKPDAAFIGVDLGTSGCRACAIDVRHEIIAENRASMPAPNSTVGRIEQDPGIWWHAVKTVLRGIASKLSGHSAESICVNGTSATTLVCTADGTPLAPALMYNDRRPTIYAERIAAVAPENSGAHGVNSGLAKMLWFSDQAYADNEFFFMHQADWIAGKLSNNFGISDVNNCLKGGYDAQTSCWPGWIQSLGISTGQLPEVVTPGTIIGELNSHAADELGFDNRPYIVAGTTDSIAAFIATGAYSIGDGVTSLGTTLAIKLLCDTPVFSARYGVYSHRLGNYWLAGGASNAGAGVLLQFFSTRELDAMTPQLKPDQPTGLDYYPLPGIGERFPIYDPDLQPRMTPLADSPLQQFQAVLEGLTEIEFQGYRRLQELGAPSPRTIRTAGGGSRNPGWLRMRQNRFGADVAFPAAPHTEAAYGSALIAAGIMKKYQTQTTQDHD